MSLNIYTLATRNAKWHKFLGLQIDALSLERIDGRHAASARQNVLEEADREGGDHPAN